MRSPGEFRKGKPGFYPDQSIYAEFACAEFGLDFRDLDGGSGLVFSVASRDRLLHFGAGRCSWYPQNNATASTLASDKYFAEPDPARSRRRRRSAANISSCTTAIARIARRDMSAATRLPVSKTLGGSAFVKPLTGSRGDFAQAVHGEAALVRYLDEVTKYYDAVLIQPIVEGIEYRVFLLDDDVLFCARKYPPSVTGDGVQHRSRTARPPITTPCAPAASRRLRCRITIHRSMPCRRRANGGRFPGG